MKDKEQPTREQLSPTTIANKYFPLTVYESSNTKCVKAMEEYASEKDKENESLKQQLASIQLSADVALEELRSTTKELQEVKGKADRLYQVASKYKNIFNPLKEALSDYRKEVKG